jgi:hypothetical protein
MNTNVMHQSMDALIEHLAERVAERQLQALAPRLSGLDERLLMAIKLADESRSTMHECRAVLHQVARLLESERGQGNGPWNEVIGTLYRIAETTDRSFRESRIGFDDLRALSKVHADQITNKLTTDLRPSGPSSVVPSEKLIAYLATEYCLGYNPEEVVLKIGKHSASLAELFTEHGVTCGAFITAYNPEGTQQSDETNAQDHVALLTQVTALGHAFIEGAGSDATGDWPAERSVFAYGMDKASACTVGRQFRQDAIVWVGPDAVPQLVLLR